MNTRRILTSLLTLTAFTLLWSGCQTPQPTEPKNPGDVVILPMRQAGVEVEGIIKPDGTLNPVVSSRSQRLPGQSFYVRDVRSTKDDAGYVNLQITASSLSTRNVNLRYRIVWFDSDGMEIEPGSSGWTNINLAPRESASLRGLARGRDAKTFRVFIQTFDFQR